MDPRLRVVCPQSCGLRRSRQRVLGDNLALIKDESSDEDNRMDAEACCRQDLDLG